VGFVLTIFTASLYNSQLVKNLWKGAKNFLPIAIALIITIIASILCDTITIAIATIGKTTITGVFFVVVSVAVTEIVPIIAGVVDMVLESRDLYCCDFFASFLTLGCEDNITFKLIHPTKKSVERETL